MDGAVRDWLLGLSLGLLALAALFLHDLHHEVLLLRDTHTDTMSRVIMAESKLAKAESDQPKPKRKSGRPHAKRVQPSED